MWNEISEIKVFSGKFLNPHLGTGYSHVTLRAIPHIWHFALQWKRQILHCLLIKEKVTAKTAYF